MVASGRQTSNEYQLTFDLISMQRAVIFFSQFCLCLTLFLLSNEKKYQCLHFIWGKIGTTSLIYVCIQNSRIVEIIEWPWNFSEHQIPNFVAWTMKQWEQKQEISFVQHVQKLAQNHNGIANNKNIQKKMEKKRRTITKSRWNRFAWIKFENCSFDAISFCDWSISSRNRSIFFPQSKKVYFFSRKNKKMMLFSKVNRSLKVQ